jgi:GST-like protein
VFLRYFPERLPSAIARYHNEVKRLHRVLDRHLPEDEWLTTEFSIADIANWRWWRIHNWVGAALDDLPNLQRWMAAVAQRPDCANGLQIPYETNYNDPDADSAGIFVKHVQAILVR